MRTLTISFCVLFLLMMSALPVSATPELCFGEVTTLDDGSKIVSLMVKNVDNLGSCDAIIELSEGVKVIDVTSGDGNALKVKASNIDDTGGSMVVMALDGNSAHSKDVVICNIAYNDGGSDSIPFKIDSAKLFDYDTYDQIRHTGNNYIERSSDSSGSSGKSTVKPTATKAAGDPATSVATISGGEAGGEGIAGSTETVDGTNGSSGEDNNGIPGFGLLAGLSVMLIAVRLLRENK